MSGLPSPLFSQAEDWQRLAKASVAVLLLGQRPSGFWGVPTNSEEVDTYYRDAEGHGFGAPVFGSYTITWNSVLALQQALGAVPTKIRNDLIAVFNANTPKGGAYGRPLPPGAKVDPSNIDILPSARHTAFALLTRMRFVSNLRSVEWSTSAQWLVQTQFKANGGWTYRISDAEVEALSTAACVAALAYFLSASNDEEPDVGIAGAIKKGWNALASLRRPNGMWDGHIPGHNDIEETANIIDLLSLKEVRETLERLKLQPDPLLDATRKALRGLARDNGWPKVPNGEPSLDASINVLVAMFDDYARSDTPGERQHLRNICDFIIEQMKTFDGGLRLQSWDWTMLIRLSSKAVTSIGAKRVQEADYQELAAAIQSLRQRNSLLVNIPKTVALGIPEESQQSFLFIFSHGKQGKGKLLLKLMQSMMYILPPVTGLIKKWLLKKATNAVQGGAT